MLKWNGSGFIVGIPARDLSDDEVKQYGGEKFLLKSGCYEKAEAVKPAKASNHKVEVSDGRN